MDDILSSRDVALMCEVEERTVRRWCVTGLLKGKKLSAWTWAILPADLDAALASGAIRKSPPRGRRPLAVLGTKQLR